MQYRVAIFDLDDTLAPPHFSPSDSMISKLSALLARVPVAIVTAASYPRIERDTLSRLQDDPNIGKLHVFSESAAQCRICRNGTWELLYKETLSDEDRAKIRQAVQETIDETHILDGLPLFGDRILDRESGVTFSTLGVGAPQPEREKWDPDRSKRDSLLQHIQQKLPSWNVFIGGLTSIDISHEGVDKSKAIHWLAQHFNVTPDQMIFIGDALYPGGNDEVVKPTGVTWRQTTGPAETEQFIAELLQ
jgi:phosphomannomutase